MESNSADLCSGGEAFTGLGNLGNSISGGGSGGEGGVGGICR